MSTYTYKELQQIARKTSACNPEWIGRRPREVFGFNNYIEIGRHWPRSANWAYHVFAVHDGNSIDDVVVCNGLIVGKDLR